MVEPSPKDPRNILPSNKKKENLKNIHPNISSWTYMTYMNSNKKMLKHFIWAPDRSIRTSKGSGPMPKVGGSSSHVFFLVGVFERLFIVYYFFFGWVVIYLEIPPNQNQTNPTSRNKTKKTTRTPKPKRTKQKTKSKTNANPKPIKQTVSWHQSS